MRDRCVRCCTRQHSLQGLQCGAVGCNTDDADLLCLASSIGPVLLADMCLEQRITLKRMLIQQDMQSLGRHAEPRTHAGRASHA
jgi:hypothetical protein